MSRVKCDSPNPKKKLQEEDGAVRGIIIYIASWLLVAGWRQKRLVLTKLILNDKQKKDEFQLNISWRVITKNTVFMILEYSLPENQVNVYLFEYFHGNEIKINGMFDMSNRSQKLEDRLSISSVLWIIPYFGLVTGVNRLI